MAKVPVFISFDFDHDEDLKTLLVGQFQERRLSLRDH